MLRARHFLSHALDTNHISIVPINSFAISERFSFPLHRHRWKTGTVLSTNLPTIMFQHNRKLYPTHNTSIRSYFCELSVPSSLKDSKRIYDLTDLQPSTYILRRVPIPDISYHMIVWTHVPQPRLLSCSIPETSFMVSISNFNTSDIDSVSVFLNVTKTCKDHTALHIADEKGFDGSLRE